MNPANLPKGTSSFSALRKAGQIYVDKTELIGRLAGSRSKIILTRPRRFGKSLLVSTFASLFRYGLRDFQGLAIEKEWTDQTYDVVHLDFSKVTDFSTVEAFRTDFQAVLAESFGELGFSLSRVT